MLILSENGYAISSKTALTLKRSVKGGVAEPNDHHKVMILSFFGRCTIPRETLSGYYKSIKAKPFELPEEDDHAFGEFF